MLHSSFPLNNGSKPLKRRHLSIAFYINLTDGSLYITLCCLMKRINGGDYLILFSLQQDKLCINVIRSVIPYFIYAHGTPGHNFYGINSIEKSRKSITFLQHTSLKTKFAQSVVTNLSQSNSSKARKQSKKGKTQLFSMEM